MAENPIKASDVKLLRDATGSPMMECKKALTEAAGDVEKAKELLRLKGIKTAGKKAGRETAEGIVAIYQHHDNKKAVLVEINCESDFVARNEKIHELGQNLAKHVLALSPEFVSRDEVPKADVEHEEELVRAESAEALEKKPEAARGKIIEGRMRKFYEQRCLLEQRYVMDESKTVEQLLQETVGALGENIRVRRFFRVEVGG